MNPQGWNRYSYVGNDPLAFTDPNGYDFFGDFFGAIGDFFSDVFNAVSSAVDSVVNFIASNPIAKAVVQIGATLVLTAILGPGGALASLGLNAGGIAAVAAFGGAAIATGLSGGNIGQVLKAGLIAGATAFAFAGLPSSGALGATFNPGNYAVNVAGSAAIGCVSSVASGGSCGSGAAAAAVGSALSPITGSVFPDARTDIGQRIGGTLVQATAGGLASVAGGGKFANGAVTGAFQYLARLGLDDVRREAPPQSRSPIDDLTGVRAPIGRVTSLPLDPLPGYGVDGRPDPGLGNPGMVVSVVGCTELLFCAGVTLTEGGNVYFPVGVGSPGWSASIIETSDMDQYGGGWSVQSSVGRIGLGGWRGAAGGNLGAVGVGVQSGFGASLTYGATPSEVREFFAGGSAH